MTVGKRIKTTREARQLSQVEVAKRIGVSKQTLYKYENGIITNIPSDKIEMLADILGTTPASLMGWRENSTGKINGQQLWYNDTETAEMAQAIFDRPDLHALMVAAMDCEPDQVQSVAEMLLRFKETNIDG